MVDMTFPAMPLSGRECSLADLTQADKRGFCDVERLQAPFLSVEESLPCAIPEQVRRRLIVARQLAVYGHFCYEFNAVSLFWSISSIEVALKLKFWELHPGLIQLKRKRSGAEELCEVPVRMLEQRLREHWHIPGMMYFNYSFKALLKWAFGDRLLPDDLPIPVQEIVSSFRTRFATEIFYERALKEGLIGPNPTPGEIEDCWNRLSEAQRQCHRYTPSGVLIEELPRFRNEMAHPMFRSFIVGPRLPLEAFELAVDIVSRLWPNVRSGIPGKEHA
jgi:hypothetical protein